MRLYMVILGLLMLAGCSGGWYAVEMPGSVHAPRPGDRVEIVRTDGAVRAGTLTAVDADTLRSDDFALAWRDVADVRLLNDEETAPVIGRYSRVSRRDGRILEGYLVAMTEDALVLADRQDDDGFEESATLTIPQAQVQTLEQRH